MSPVLVVIEDEDVRRLTASGDEERSEERAEDMAEEEAARGSRSIALEAATFVATSHFEAVGSHVEMCALSDLSSRIVRGHNLVLVGDVAFQDRARRYISRELNHSVPSTASGGGDSGPPGPPVRLYARRRSESTSVLQVGPCRFAAPGVGLVFTSPRYEPDGSARIDLVVTATDDVGLLEVRSGRSKVRWRKWVENVESLHRTTSYRRTRDRSSSLSCGVVARAPSNRSPHTVATTSAAAITLRGTCARGRSHGDPRRRRRSATHSARTHR